MTEKAPIYLGRVADVANGTVPSGYAFLQALLGTDHIDGRADVYDRPFGGMQLKVEWASCEDSVLVTPLDVDGAVRSELTRNRSDETSDWQHARLRQVESYARTISPAGSILRVD